ncbi:MAG: hypothetical protein QNJ15_13180, partial [Erythrobacter sp.]|nr:hypothetical protein [Erythrobacter sp.]
PLARGQLLELAGYTEKAGDYYLQAMDDEDKSVRYEALARYVIIMLKLDRREEALERATELANLEPKFALKSVLQGEEYTSMALLGDAMAVNERIEGAKQAYEVALQILPEDPYVSGRLAMIHLTDGDVDSASKLNRAASNNPRYSSLSNMLRLAESGLVRPALEIDKVVSVIVVSPAGRPFDVGGVRTADVVERGDWS